MKPIQVAPLGSCRVCGAENWHTYLDFGHLPLADSFATDRSAPERIALTVAPAGSRHETNVVSELELAGSQGCTIGIGATA